MIPLPILTFLLLVAFSSFVVWYVQGCCYVVVGYSTPPSCARMLSFLFPLPFYPRAPLHDLLPSRC